MECGREKVTAHDEQSLIEKQILKFDVLLLHVARVLMFYAWFLSKKQLYPNRFLSGKRSVLQLCNAKNYG